jgi:branched-chain amino acid transport system substrate-binding protein
MRMPRCTVVSAIVIALAVGAAGCGSSSSNNNGGTTATAGGSGGSATSTTATGSGASSKAPYVLGVIASESGPLASTIGSMGPTVQAWGKWTNAHGGISGHKVVVDVVNDAGNPATALSGVKQLVEQDHIIALVNASGSETSFAAYTKQAKLPVVGGLDGSTLYETNGNYFAQGPSEKTWNEILLQVAKKRGQTKIGGIYCAEVPACAGALQTTKALAAPLGMKLVSNSSASSTAADYTAQCLAAKQAGAQALDISAATQVQLNVATSCAKQNFRVPLLVGNIEFNNSWLKVPATDGSYGVMPVFPFTDSSSPATKAFQAAMSQYLPSVKSSSTFGAENASAWVSGALFAAAAKAGDMGNTPSSAGILKGLYALKGSTLGGLSGPLSYVQGADPNVNNKCAFQLAIANGKFTEPNGGKPTCSS